MLAVLDGVLSEIPFWFFWRRCLLALTLRFGVVDCVVYCVFVLTNGLALRKKREEITPKPMQAAMLILQHNPAD